MTKFSAWSVFWNGMTGQKGWKRQWRDPEPKRHYDVVIVGGGLHGLATAYYLGKNHGIKNIAILEKGWIGGGNAGRNTTIVRSNYVQPGNREFYEHSLKLWENLSFELNYNVMFSQRSHISLLQILCTTRLLAYGARCGRGGDVRIALSRPCKTIAALVWHCGYVDGWLAFYLQSADQ
ncbi:MAG: heterotetrameric sarcosine oxidase beta subunit [Oceanospirillaceae bacterium]|jgi:heterotetrameric sarcosine oxidase beta subunit